MVQHEDETERYLKEFLPRALSELEIESRLPDAWAGRVAATVALVLLTGAAFWISRRDLKVQNEAADVRAAHSAVTAQSQYHSALALTELASTDQEKFESLLANKSRESLPSFRGEESTLKVLAKE